MIFSFDVGVSMFKPSGKESLFAWHSMEEGGTKQCCSKQCGVGGQGDCKHPLMPPPRGGGGEIGQHAFQPEEYFFS